MAIVQLADSARDVAKKLTLQSNLSRTDVLVLTPKQRKSRISLMSCLLIFLPNFFAQNKMRSFSSRMAFGKWYISLRKQPTDLATIEQILANKSRMTLGRILSKLMVKLNGKFFQ
jgi:hypothetical protein